jgi:hypothetical protein
MALRQTGRIADALATSDEAIANDQSVAAARPIAATYCKTCNALTKRALLMTARLS